MFERGGRFGVLLLFMIKNQRVFWTVGVKGVVGEGVIAQFWPPCPLICGGFSSFISQQVQRELAKSEGISRPPATSYIYYQKNLHSLLIQTEGCLLFGI